MRRFVAERLFTRQPGRGDERTRVRFASMKARGWGDLCDKQVVLGREVIRGDRDRIG